MASTRSSRSRRIAATRSAPIAGDQYRGRRLRVRLVERPGPIRLCGVGESSDGYHISAPDPSGRGAETAIRAALAQAGVAGRDVGYVNLHGTGTRRNDEMESQVVARVFGPAVPCSSTKPLIGHALGAAGAQEIGLCWLLLGEENAARRLPEHAWDGIRDPSLPSINLAGVDQRSSRPVRVELVCFRRQQCRDRHRASLMDARSSRIAELLPHGPEMTLIERLVEYSPDARCDGDDTRAAHSSKPAECQLGSGIEYMAQTIAAHAGYEGRLRGKAPADRFPARHAGLSQRGRRFCARRDPDDQRPAFGRRPEARGFQCAIAGDRQLATAVVNTDLPAADELAAIRGRSREPMTRSVLVTGASKGIGAAIAAALGGKGFTVAVHYFSDGAGAQHTAEAIRGAGGGCRLIRFDVGDRAVSRHDRGRHRGSWRVLRRREQCRRHRDNAFPLLTEQDWDEVLRTISTASTTC